jgi:zinc finger protein 830
MSDVRALLKAKRQEARIDHALASYTPSGQLRCIVCETNIKHASAWEGHLGSKLHRTNRDAARLKEEERLRKQQELEEEATWLKRKADEADMSAGSAAKKPKTTPVFQPSTSDLPSDFFSDPSQGPLPPSYDSDDEADAIDATSAKPQGTTADLDQEWIRFQQTVINAPDERETYDRATVFAQPDLVLDVPNGFPADEAQVEPVAKLDEGGERRRKEQEERELIMDRLMDEERAQEEADMKVVVMKNRLAALRKRREASRSAKIESRVS